MLVVGASGPLGRAVTRDLVACGHAVTGVSRCGGAGSQRLDVADYKAVGEFLGRIRPEAVVYLARPDFDGASDSGRAVEQAIRNFQRFVHQCRSVDVQRLSFASSSAVYGTEYSSPRSEDDPTVRSSYADLKAGSELILEGSRETAEFSTVSLRIFNVYGPGFSNSLINRLVLGANPVVYDTEFYVRDYIHVSDVARAFRHSIDAWTAVDPAILNVGTGRGTSNRTLLAMLPGAPHRFVENQDLHSFSIADVSRIRAMWQFEAEVNLHIAVRSRNFFG